MSEAFRDPAPSPSRDQGDVSLIRWLLSLTVKERLQVLQSQANAMARLRDAAAER